jgi:hypothetical protein
MFVNIVTPHFDGKIAQFLKMCLTFPNCEKQLMLAHSLKVVDARRV